MICTWIYFSTTLPKTEATAGARLSFPPEERRSEQSIAKKIGLALAAAKPSACRHRPGRCAGASPGISLGRRVRNTVEKSETEGGREDKQTRIDNAVSDDPAVGFDGDGLQAAAFHDVARIELQRHSDFV